MSSGTIHTKASLLTAGTLLLTRVGFPNNVELAVGALIGILISCDLDVDAGHVGDYYIRRCGWIGRALEKVWDLFWWPYRQSLKHGSPLSHWPIISTFIRVIYIVILSILAPYLVREILVPGAWDLQRELTWWLNLFVQHQAVFWGMCSTDFVHFGLDITTTDHKKKGK